MDTIAKTIADYKQLLDDMSKQYTKTVAEAHSKMQELLDSAEQQTKTPEKPDSAWIEKDGERYLLMNASAVDHMNKMFDMFRGVIEELVKREKSNG